MVVAMGTVFTSVYFSGAQMNVVTPTATDVDNAKELGKLMFTEYLYPFEIAGAILLVAIVAAISLTLRKGRSKKSQNPAEQVSVKRKDRVRLVKMNSEKKSG
jgi:NADH-quinone oxidoreductase subunit J